jgi:hypothetical protein
VQGCGVRPCVSDQISASLRLQTLPVFNPCSDLPDR